MSQTWTCSLVIRSAPRHQLGVDRDAADVVDVAVGHRRPVDLRLQHLSLHVAPPCSLAFMWSDQDVVDQPRRADLGGDARPEPGARRARPPARGSRRRAPPGTRARSRRRPARARPASSAGRQRPARGLALGRGSARESAVGALALARVEVGVARAHRQAVGLAHGRQHLDPHREVEVADHAPDHRRLLGVLLAEVGDVGADRVEELGDDGGDAAEVARAAPARGRRRGPRSARRRPRPWSRSPPGRPRSTAGA